MSKQLMNHLTPLYNEGVLKRWERLLAKGDKITDENVKRTTAIVLENTQREFDKHKLMLTESTDAQQGGAFGSQQPLGGVNDSRQAAIVIPTLRRIFPELVAHNLVGVQPMNSPLAFAYAIRHLYDDNGRGVAGGTQSKGTEMGYNTIDSSFTGASGLVGDDRSADYMATAGGYPGVPGVGAVAGDTANDFWQAFAGADSDPLGNGMGASLESSEWWGIGTDMPMSSFRLEKGAVQANTRKLAAHWSLELEEDMMNMSGIDTDAEMVNVMSYEIQAEIDRQLLGEMIKAAIIGGNTSLWSPVSADGRNQLERIGTIYTQLLIKSQLIAKLTRRGPATFAIAASTCIALLERLGDFTLDTASVTADANVTGVSQVGTMRNGGITLYRDTHAQGEYILLGYKGPTPYDAGIIYCPYIPVQLHRAQSESDFSPRIGVRTRYGVLASLFGSANYYQMIKVNGITNEVLQGDSGRVFTY